VFDVAHAAGLTTALFSGKVKIRHTARPESVDALTARFLPDASIVVLARHALDQAPPHLMFVHLPNVDRAGHQYGWRSERQREALRGTDLAVASILEAVERNPSRRVRIILTADHSGEGRSHDRVWTGNQRVPWILWGDGIRPERLGSVAITITASVALRSLGLDVPTPMDGS
jgi:predicted AlkP superfamily pyrophosphatase or phosphodiesterase